MIKRPVGRPRKEPADPELEIGKNLTPIVDLQFRKALHNSVHSTLKSHGIISGHAKIYPHKMTEQLLEALLYHRELLSMKLVRQKTEKTGPKQAIADQALILDVRKIFIDNQIPLKYWRNGRETEDGLHKLITDLCRNSGINTRFNASTRSYNSKSLSFMPIKIIKS